MSRMSGPDLDGADWPTKFLTGETHPLLKQSESGEARHICSGRPRALGVEEREREGEKLENVSSRKTKCFGGVFFFERGNGDEIGVEGITSLRVLSGACLLGKSFQVWRPFNTDPAVPGRGVGSTLERGPDCYEEHRSVGPAVLLERQTFKDTLMVISF